MENDEFIRGETIEGEYYAPGAPTPKHGEKIDQALQSAVDRLPAGDPEWFEVRLLVHVKHESPGWVDGYSVQLVRPPH